MAMDYGKCAREIFENLGGRENLVSAAHCATRLRLVLKELSLHNELPNVFLKCLLLFR